MTDKFARELTFQIERKQLLEQNKTLTKNLHEMRKQNATAEEKVTAAEAKATAAEESANDARRRAKAAEVQTNPNIPQLANFVTSTHLTADLFMSSGTSRDSQVRAWCAQRSRTAGEKTPY